jgi:hypothetical protein
MTLDLEVAGTVRELTEDERPPPSTVSHVQKLRESHHALARALARGQTPIQASQATGYRVSRIYLLLRDPTFMDLVTYYKTDDEEARADIEARFAGMTADFMQELHDRLLDDPESLKPELLHDVIKTFADRAGYAPVSRSKNLNINYSYGDRLDALKNAAARKTKTEEPIRCRVIEVDDG